MVLLAHYTALFKTHDAWTSSEPMLAVLERVGRDGVACCWDVKHTYWVGKETPETTWGRLQGWVRNTHWKDVRGFRGPMATLGRDLSRDGLLCPLGEGIVPLETATARSQIGRAHV